MSPPAFFLISVEDRDVDHLLGGGQDRLAYSGSERAWSESTPIAHLPAASMALIVPLPVRAGDGLDDVRALVEEGLGELLALGRVAPRVVATDEGAGLGRGIPAEELDAWCRSSRCRS